MSSVVDFESMSREELVAMASGAKREKKPYIRDVEIDGVKLSIDMRRVKDYRTMSLLAKVEGGDEFAAVSLFDFILGDNRDAAIEALSDEDGFCDATRFADFCSRVFEACGAKN